MTATCAPPEEHRDKPWHWLETPFELWQRVQWVDGRWQTYLGRMQSPATLYELGWRYVAPAIPPTQEG
jgi:hypothetical protein